MFNLNEKERKKERAIWKEILLDFFFLLVLFDKLICPFSGSGQIEIFVDLFCINSRTEIDLPPGQKIS